MAKEKTEKKDKKEKKEPTYIMRVGVLSWGRNKRNHFFNDDKPLISKSVMKEYASTIDAWIEAGWIEEGSYSTKK